MHCPHCQSPATREQAARTGTYRCTACCHRFNERTGIPFNYLELLSDIVFLAVVWRLRYAGCD